jgi:hypothetical protein
LGEDIKEQLIVQKKLRSLPMRFDPKISSLEERAYLGTISMDELHGIFIAYEMRTKQYNPPKKEVAFKASRKTRKNKHGPKKNLNSDYSCNDAYNEDEEMVNFKRKLKKGTNKYKGKLPFKCFNFGKIGHFSNKFPYSKDKENDEE